MTAIYLLYISILIFSLTGLYTYRKNFKSLLFLIFAIFQTYFYFNETNTTFNNVLQKISLYSSEFFSIVGILILIGILLFIFMKIISAMGNDEQKYYARKRKNNVSAGDVAGCLLLGLMIGNGWTMRDTSDFLVSIILGALLFLFFGVFFLF